MEISILKPFPLKIMPLTLRTLRLSALSATACSVLYFSVFPVSAANKIYKVVQTDGTVIYTDKPTPGAKEFQINIKPNVISPPPTTKTAPSSRTFLDTKDTVKPVHVIPDHTVTVSAPSNEETIRSNEGKVSIIGSLSPSAGGTFELYLNGALKETNTIPQFHLAGLDRGEYQVQIRFLDQTGKLLASSPLSKFYLQKVSALLRPN